MQGSVEWTEVALVTFMGMGAGLSSVLILVIFTLWRLPDDERLPKGSGFVMCVVGVAVWVAVSVALWVGAPSAV